MWAKFTDAYDENPKVRASGKDGRALDQAGIRYCARHLTDGLIPDHDLPVLAALAEVPVKRTVTRLVEAGRWHGPGHQCERCPTCPAKHHVVHDYLEFNPLAERELAKRAARAEAGRKGGQRSRPPSSNSEANVEAIASPNGEANIEAPANPVPVPVPPVVTSAENSRRLSGQPDDDDQDPQAVDNPPAGTLDAVVAQALDVLVERDLTDRQTNSRLPPINDIAAWKRKATRQRTDRGTPAALLELARLHPAAGATELADLLEPPTAPADVNAWGQPIDRRMDGQQAAMMRAAAEGQAHMAEVRATPPADPDTVGGALAAARAHLRPTPGDPT